jgi:hypothetical protein
MEIVLLDKKSPLPSWLPSYVKVADLPGHTYVVMLNGEGVAMAALRLCEGTICMLDSMASHNKFSSEIRHKALDLLVDTIKAKAVSLGFNTLLAYTKEPTVLTRSFRHGFTQLSEILIVKEL